MTWLEYIIKAFGNLGGVANYKYKYYSEGHHIKPLGLHHNGQHIKENIMLAIF